MTQTIMAEDDSPLRKVLLARLAGDMRHMTGEFPLRVDFIASRLDGGSVLVLGAGIPLAGKKPIWRNQVYSAYELAACCWVVYSFYNYQGTERERLELEAHAICDLANCTHWHHDHQETWLI